MTDPYQVVRDFERALCDYTGAPYCVTTTSCTMAILLAAKWWLTREFDADQNTMIPHFSIPKRTYVGVPMSLMHAGAVVDFRDEDWEGDYLIDPAPIWDSARWLTSDQYPSYNPGAMVCLSFHPTKHLGISTHGGAILHDDPKADQWLRMMRFDGRREGIQPKDQHGWVVGYHCYMNPVTAAEGLQRLAVLPKHNAPLPNSDYPDLSKLEIFNEWT